MIRSMRGWQRACGRVIAGICVGLAASSLSLGGARAADSEAGGPVDLSTDADIRVDGPLAGEQIGRSVAGAGDVNGDGKADLVIGSPFASSPGGSGADGATYVVFGRQEAGVVDLASAETAGFKIIGYEGGMAGSSIGGLPDTNGDGLAEVIVGAPLQRISGVRSGAVFVVFGKRGGADVDLSHLGAGGFRIAGAHAESLAGYSAAAAGDVNADGIADLVVGAPDTGTPGTAWVVFGRSTAQDVDLAHLQADQGFRVDGIARSPAEPVGGNLTGGAVDGAGDVNGDGLADVVVGAVLAHPHGTTSGSAYVVFGKRSGDAVNLASPPDWGFQVDGMSEFDAAGAWAGGAGDVNGDQLGDVIVAAPGTSYNDRPESGSASVVFGKPSHDPLVIGALGTHGFRIDGPERSFPLGHQALSTVTRTVGGAGDVNGDGYADLIVGSGIQTTAERPESGSAWVVYGGPSITDVDLAASLAGRGFQIIGAAAGDLAGVSVAAAGDVNGDGAQDVVVSAPWADNNQRRDSGSAYVIYGFRPRPRNKDDCKKGGYLAFGFRTQGQCIQAVRDR